jgi:hypothetical protein
MEEIERKTKRRKEARIEAAVSQTIEGIVFDFFKNYDSLCVTINSINGEDDFNYLYRRAFREMEERIHCIDLLAKVSVFFPGIGKDDPLDSSKKPQSVTIYWGLPYQKKNNSPESTSIDVSQMLFF